MCLGVYCLPARASQIGVDPTSSMLLAPVAKTKCFIMSNEFEGKSRTSQNSTNQVAYRNVHWTDSKMSLLSKTGFGVG